ncbi:hypothetical protein ULG90_24795 [Halopseudomonas pachastrellae]|nr:hypothetical protein UMZ34_16655 [Halopseudomonas pachastrellae]WVM92609.1 hypothetical protein ULG90_24795 [Halopseudomonas pachastrellae]
MDNEKSRAEFESWAKAEQGLDMHRLPHGAYRSFATHQAWWAWRASRKALVVELPVRVTRANGFDSSEDDEFYNLGIDHCARQINAAGITVKEGA